MVGILKPLNPHEEPPIIGIQLGTLILKDIELIFRIRLFIILNAALKPKHETINEQILKFAQNYPTSFKTASSDAPFFMNWCRLPIRSVLT